MDIKRIEEFEISEDSKSDSDHNENSVEKPFEVTANLIDKVDTEENDSISKEEKVVKYSERLMEDIKVLQNTDSKSVECVAIVDNPLRSSDSQQDEKTSEDNIPSAKLPNGKLEANHRQHDSYASDDSDSETDDSDSDTDDSSDSDLFLERLRRSALPNKLSIVKPKVEPIVEDLPPVEDLHITVEAAELQKVGKVFQILCKQVVIASDGNSNPLNEESVLFLSADKPLGKVDEVFGNVSKPKYTVRFNKIEDIQSNGITIGQDVYYSPANEELTHYVLVDAIKQQKGSDASWKDNNEPPDDQIDYSDDEQEKIAKQKRKAKHRRNEQDSDDDVQEIVSPNKMERRHSYNQEKTFMAANCSEPSRNNLRSLRPGSSRATRSHLPIRSFCSTELSSAVTSSVQSSKYTPASPSSNYFLSQISPQPFGPLSQNNVPSPQSFGPLLQSNGPPPHSFGPLSQSNVPSPQPFGQLPPSHMPSQQFGSFPQSNVSSPQSFGPFPPSSVPSPQPFGTFMQSTLPVRGPFTAQVFASSSPSSHVSASPQLNLASSCVPGAPQQTHTSLMGAPQNTVPLQQQFLLQSQQSASSFMPHPPPNYNSYQNPRTFQTTNLLQQSTTTPVFGALPTSRPAVQNLSNQSFVNQIVFPFGTNCPPAGLPRTLNVSQPSNINMNANRHQGQSFGMTQSHATNPLMFQQFSSRNTQSNNLHNSVSQPAFGLNHSSLPSPCPTPPLMTCPTPPPFSNQPSFSILSSPHPLVVQTVPFQTPPPAIQLSPFTLPVAGSTVSLTPNYPYC